MNKSSITLIFAAVLLFIRFAAADTWTTSVISSNTTWVKNNGSGDGVYVVDVTNDTLRIASGARLTIEPGVTVKFHDDLVFVVEGELDATGTATDSIVFTLDDAVGSATEWGGIKLKSGAGSVNKLVYCRIEYGDADNSGVGAPQDATNGGGIFCGVDIDANTEISHCTIQHNKAVDGGGGIFCVGSPTIKANLIQNNTAGQFGGGIALKGSSLSQLSEPVIQNNIIIHNSADGQGGGGIAFFSSANVTMFNDLIYGNESLNGSGGGINIYGSTNLVQVRNAVIRGNTANSDDQIFGVPDVTYSNVEGGYSGEGNIDADPQFDDPANNDFHVQATSPIVDTGTDTDAPTTDFDGNARPFDGDRDGQATVDMGPYEYQNTPPQITSTPVTEATEDQLYSYTVVAEDPDAAETLTYSLVEGPAFLSMDASTGVLSGTPATDADAGDHTVTVQVADLNNATDTQTFNLHVTAVNDAPVVSGIPDQTIDEGGTFASINLDDYVTDEDNTDEEMTWTYSGNTQLVVTIDENRVATITIPDPDWYGTETITFTATDPGGLSGSDAAVFTVNNINDAPEVSDIPDQTIDEGGQFATINLDDYVTDIDNVKQDLTWTYSGNSELSVTIDENHVATITTPNEDWYGSETITFTATDPGGLSDSDPAVFTVNAINDAPVVSDIPDQTINEGESFLSIALDDYVSDVDNSDAEITWTYSGNSELQVTISGDHVATIAVPNEDWFGSETITFTATDPGDSSDSDAATFTVVNVNDAPVAVNDTVTTDEDTPLTVHVLNNDSDIDGDALIVESVTAPANGTVEISGDTTVVYTPSADWSGSDSFDYTISDGNGGTSTATVYVTVQAVNDAPVVSDIPDQTVNEGETFATINLDDYVSDVDNSDAEMTWTYSGNTELTVSIDENHVATVTIPDSNWFGAETITFTATDPGGLSNSDAAVFTVNNVNDAPVVSQIPDQTINEGETFATISLDDYVSDIDNSDSDITWTYSGNSELQVSIDENRVATISAPDSNWFGSENITFTATDPGGLADSTTAAFTVNPVNDAPVVSDIPDQTVNEGETFATINLDDYVTDVDNTDAEMTWTYSGNTVLTVSIDENHVATVTIPDSNWYGSETITFTATDPGGLSGSDAAVFTVNNVNDAPVVSDIPDQTVNEGETFATINLDDYVSDIDNGDSEITWTYSGNSELQVSIDANRVATISAPDSNWFGSETITFTATDPGGLSGSDAAVFTVNNVNDAPLVSDIPDQTVSEGQPFADIALDDYVSDVDDADSTLTWTVSGQSVLQITIDENRVAHISVPDSNWNGSETVTFRVEDSGGLSDQDAATFTVNATNDAPVVADIPDQTIAEGDSFMVVNLDDYVSDIDNADSEISWTVSGNTELLVAVDSVTRTVKIAAPNADWNGKEQLVFTATDPGGLSDKDSAWFTVTAVNDAPVLTQLPDQVISEGQTFPEIALDDYVNDVDDPDSALTWHVSGYTELQVSVSLDRVLTVTPPSADWNGAETLIFTVTDAGGLKDTMQALFKVTPVNDSTKFVQELPVLAFNEDDTLAFAKSGWFPYVEDADNPDSTLTLTAFAGKYVQVTQDAKTCVFKAPADWFGQDTLMLTASDGQYADSAYFYVTVRPVNDAPVISGLPDEISFDSDTTYQLVMKEYAQDVDSPDSLLVWSFEADNDSLIISYDAKTSVLTLSAPDFGGQVALICTVSDDSAASVSDTIRVQVNLVTGIANEQAGLPKKYELGQNYPNPFNPATNIKFALPEGGKVKLEVYNILGKKIATLVDGYKPAGYHVVKFDARRFSSGLYFYKLQTKDYVKVRKMVLMK